ncbi:DASH complex subunit HSK3 family protein [Aspergillus stella-maris]|uniref:DASH complex subunit HSK3 family protein n=1 Tax=Aspergillus stella-maris TaxID=1810926 RepID=UPI003CCDD859
MPPTYRPSMLPPSSSYGGSASSMSATKTRQYAQLQSQLAQLNANLSNTEEIVQMTAHQAKDMRFLGGYVGALFMGSAKVLGEEGVMGAGGPGNSEKGGEK